MQNEKNGKHSQGQEDHSQKAYKGIRRMLYYKDLVPGQKVSGRDVAERLDMSLTPVIQALKFMEFQGFIRHEPNRGYFMTPFTLEELEEIYELRELLEPSFIPYIVRHLKKEGKKRLKETLKKHRSAVKEAYPNERLFKNMEFHLTLASLSNKSVQIRVLRNIFDILLLKYGGNHGSVEPIDLVDEEHQKIFECVVSGNSIEAQKILTRHIVNVKKQVIERFRKILDRRNEPEF
ncbi:GntR family transcriptional regulator [Thermodesulfobacteriota bacterium]